MKTAKKPILLVVVLLLSAFLEAKADVLDDIALLLKSGNTKELAHFMAPSVELELLEEGQEYSRAEAVPRLKSFLSKYPPVTVKIIHRINSHTNFRYGVMKMVTEKSSFRLSISLKSISGKFLITEIKADPDTES